MTLAEGTTPVVEWDESDPPKITVAIVCHCGEAFPVDQIDQAREHVAGHTEVPGNEPS